MKLIELSIVERQILYNQFLILEKIYDDPGYGHNATILEKGFTIQYQGIFNVHSNEIPYHICKETIDILEMYRIIDNAIAQLDDSDKESMGLDKLKFQGFDATYDDHYDYAKFLIKDLGRWDEYKDFPLNSHGFSSLDKYRTMLEVLKRLKESHSHAHTSFDLDKKGMEEMINAI